MIQTYTATFALKAADFLNTLALFSNDEGVFIFYGGEGKSYLFLYPLEVIKTSSWDELESKIDSSETWVGFLSYEMCKNIEKNKSLPNHSLDFPYSYFQRSKIECVFDHTNQEISVKLNDELPNFKKFLEPSFWKNNSLNKFEVKDAKITKLEDASLFSKKIEKAKEYIRLGEVYQVNISHEIEFEVQVDPYLFFIELIKENPAPFAFFCKIDGNYLISISPEQLIKKENQILQTRPIKGTRPRGKSEEEDEILKAKLKESPKERSELLMITDLMRNDFGRIAIPCSVNVCQSFCVESYSTVHHLVSTVSCKVDPIKSNIEILKNIFPGGSISGCPKLRAIEIIFELEEKARGIYTGSLGFFAKGGDFVFNIAIRTVIKKINKFYLRVGGGIVIDSDPLKEYEETIHKGRPFFNVLGIRI